MTKRTIMAVSIILLLASAVLAAGSGISIRVITSEDLKAEMETGKPMPVVIDARTEEEYNKGHIPGAINIPPSKFGTMGGYLPMKKSVPLVFYCRGYSCTLSQSAATEALKLGYTNVRIFRGGYPEWSQKGYKVAK